MALLKLKLPLLKDTLITEDKFRSDPETVDHELDLESGTNHHELHKPTPGMWRYPKNPDLCCIYRVPNCLRQVNPEAYTPQLVIIGPLHLSLKSRALKSRGDITSTKLMGYLNVEEHKKIYLKEFTQRVEAGEKTIDGFRSIIERDEGMIRASYSESTDWIESPDFVDMILHDSVFVLEFLLRSFYAPNNEKTGDPLIDEPCLESTVKKDLILLENQLPYFILEKLFGPIVPTLIPDDSFRNLVITYYGFEGKIGNYSNFKHFTDLVRLVHVESPLPEHASENSNSIEHMYNADKLDSGGIKFEAIEGEFSLYVGFENGCLKMPCLKVADELEMTIRNVMALEQCHYPFDTHVCNYFIFLDYLINTDKDVDLLVEKGIIKNWIGHHGLVAEMVNKLCEGIIDVGGSDYSDIAGRVNAHYSDPFNKSRAILKRVYFGNLWTGTATVAATLLLLMTLIQTVASILQVMQ